MGRPPQTDRIRIAARLPYVLLPQEEGLRRDGPPRRGAWWVAQCGLFGVSGEGRTERSALRNLRLALLVHIEGCMAHGTWGEALREAGLAALDLAGHRYWVGGAPPAAAPQARVLEFSGYVACPPTHRAPLPAQEVRIPSAPDWLIRADRLG